MNEFSLHIGPSEPRKLSEPEEKRSLGGILKDAGKQIGVSLLILAIAFFAMNAGAYYQIAKSKINKLLGIETQSELTKVVEAETKTEKLTKTNENALKRLKTVPVLGMEIMPPDTRLVIPAINQNIPVVGTTSANLLKKDWGALEKDIQNSLKDGVVHYPGTSWPDQTGNTAITGHSSYFPWDPGRFKDVFALLHDVNVGDKVALYYKQHKYIYQISEKKVVMPDNIEILKQTTDKRLTLITCTPVGTNLKRLVVIGQLIEEQI